MSTPPIEPPDTPERMTNPTRSSRRTLWIAALTLLTVLLGFGALLTVVWMPGIQMPMQPAEPGQSATVADANPTRNAPSPSATLAPTGKLAAPGNTSPTGTTAQGDEFALQSQLDSAITQYDAATRAAPADPTPLIHWSRVLAFRGQMLDAIAKAEWAAQRAPQDAEAQAQLARALAWKSQGDDEDDDSDPLGQALTLGEGAVQLDPNNAYAHATLAEIYLLVKRPADAQRQAEQAVALAPSSADAHGSLAWVLTLAAQKDSQGALAEWQRSVALEPNLFYRHFEFGQALQFFFRDPTNAISEYQKALALYDSYAPAHAGLGLAYLEANQMPNAIAQFKRALALNENDDDSAAYLGIALGRTNQCQQAISYFNQALNIDANNSVAAQGLLACRAGHPPSVPHLVTPALPLTPPSLDEKSNL